MAASLPIALLGACEIATQALQFALLVVRKAERRVRGSARRSQALSAVATAAGQSPSACCNCDLCTKHCPR